MEFEDLKPKKTILIIGVNSFVGSNLAEFFKSKYRVVGTYHNSKARMDGIFTIHCDVLNKEQVNLVHYAFKPDYTIYCVGLSSVNDCHRRPELAEALNAGGVYNVTDACQRYRSKLIYISTALVFSGNNKQYIEVDMPDSLTTYGRTKTNAEFYIQKTSLNYLIFRTCVLYGRSYNPLTLTWFERMQKNLKFSKTYPVDDNLRIGFLDIFYLGMAIQMTFEKTYTNRMFQLSSSDVMTHYQFCKKYCEIFHESEQLLSKSRWAFPLDSHAVGVSWDGGALYYQMKCTNIESSLSLKLPTIEESINFTFKRLGGVPGHVHKKTSGGTIKFI